MEKRWKKFDLAVMSHDPDATIWRIIEPDNQGIGVIDATIEKPEKSQKVKFIDKSFFMMPNESQLNNFYRNKNNG